MVFELFDPGAEVCIREGGNLPHWYQPGVTYFITFRTEDSIPLDVARRWRQRRNVWLRQHGIDPDARQWKHALDGLPRSLQREFHSTFSREYLEALDRGCGACVLSRPEIAKTAADSLLHFDGERYEMGDFVVMPNHVHLLVCQWSDTEPESQCYSWKKFTAGAINRQLGRRGRFWQEESFDHLVRSVEQFEAIRRYIAHNPRDANLPDGKYLHYRRSPP